MFKNTAALSEVLLSGVVEPDIFRSGSGFPPEFSEKVPPLKHLKKEVKKRRRGNGKRRENSDLFSNF